MTATKGLPAIWRARARGYRDQMDMTLPNRAGQAERDSLVWRARAYETCAEELQLALSCPPISSPTPGELPSVAAMAKHLHDNESGRRDLNPRPPEPH